MPIEILYLLHLLATVVWVGGMFFAHQCLRPAALAVLDAPQRLRLWRGVFARFFVWVWAAVILLIVSGKWLIEIMGGGAVMPMHVHAMAGIGYLMALIFAFIWFVPYRVLRQAVAGEDWTAAAAALNRIRILVGLNLSLGLVNIALIVLGPLLL